MKRGDMSRSSSSKSSQNSDSPASSTQDMSPPAMAVSTIASSPQSSSSTASKNTTDTLFEPSVDMMVNDFDDERTLEEEEALAATEQEDPNAELSSLQREGDMPIEELLALYNCTPAADLESRPRSSTSSSNVENESEGLNGDEKDEDEPSELRKLYPETFHNKPQSRLLRTISRQSDEEDDGDYSPDDDDFKKTIMVGSDFQAPIPEGLCKYDDALPYENEDKLVWNPSQLRENDIEDYLNKTAAAIAQNATGLNSIPQGIHLKDDEQALYLLLQCGYNIEEALRRRRINAVSSADTMSLWSEEECRNFENGLRACGKDFHSIQHTKVRTRSVGELVQFYYLWKKTERHDVFANKARLDKKKYSLHPGLTDYMDRFLEEQETNGTSNNNGSGNNTGGGGGSGTGSSNNSVSGVVCTGGGRSTSPGINCLLYTDFKRHRTHLNPHSNHHHHHHHHHLHDNLYHHHGHGGGKEGGGLYGDHHGISNNTSSDHHPGGSL